MSYLRWILRIVAWDGLLPVFVVSVPLAIQRALPGERVAVEITAIVLPISAFLLRAAIGIRHIAASRCAGVLRKLQFLAFGIALLILVLIECALILTHVMPAGALFGERDDLTVLAVIYAVYFGLMAIAFFPAASVSTADE